MNKILPLTKSADLKIYFFIARFPAIEIPKEGVISVLGYNLESAIPRAKEKMLEKNYQLKYVGGQPVKELLESIESISKPKPAPELKKSLAEIKKMNLEQFKNSILLVADEFVKKGADKIILKSIIKNL